MCFEIKVPSLYDIKYSCMAWIKEKGRRFDNGIICDSDNLYLVFDDNFQLKQGHNAINNNTLKNKGYNYLIRSLYIEVKDSQLYYDDISHYVNEHKSDIQKQLNELQNVIDGLLNKIPSKNEINIYFDTELNKVLFRYHDHIFSCDNVFTHKKTLLNIKYDKLSICTKDPREYKVLLDGFKVINIKPLKGSENKFIIDVDDAHYNYLLEI